MTPLPHARWLRGLAGSLLLVNVGCAELTRGKRIPDGAHADTRTETDAASPEDTLPGEVADAPDAVDTEPIAVDAADTVEADLADADDTLVEVAVDGTEVVDVTQDGSETGPDTRPVVGCATCHGSEGDPAPPRDLHGNWETTAIGVGAHERHLGPSDWRAEVSCSACHVVPTSVGDVGHLDTPLPAELTWGGLAAHDGANPSWSGASCSGVYCHGATLPEGGFEPVWTQGPDEGACGTCHGVPPSRSHVQRTDCATCHPNISEGWRFTDPSTHIDGLVQVRGETCTTCHGGQDGVAPPVDLRGEVATSSRGVGAHQSHLAPSDWRAPIACLECHAVPSAVGDAGHLDSELPAELTWGDRAQSDDAAPSWNGSSCAGVYCHGATLSEGGFDPTWTAVGEGEAGCGTCHGAPPALPHPQNGTCASCHPSIAADGTFPDPARHIDGIVDTSLIDGCSSCHGSEANAAPPFDLLGQVSTSARGVGAHQSHLGISDWHAQLGCRNCHVVPVALDDAGHLDLTRPADVTFSDLAVQRQATPSWNGLSCSGTYCHGAPLADGGATPVWTRVGSGEAACGTCHGLPPAAPHVAIQDCALCHAAVIGGDNRSFVEPSRHIDGVVQSQPVHPPGWAAPGEHGAVFNNLTGPAGCTSCHGALLEGGASAVSCDGCHAATSTSWQTDCTFCHGGADNDTGAPPWGIDGEAGRGTLAVGAHTPHVHETSLHVAWGCERCHKAPTDIWTIGHIDGNGRAEVSFGAPNAAGTYQLATGTCASGYCHGNGRGNNGTAVWTNDPPQLSCSSCHQDATNVTETGMSGAHDKHIRDKGIKCVSCHAGTVNAQNAITGLAQHVDGDPDVVLQLGGTWNASTHACTPTCHQRENWFD